MSRASQFDVQSYLRQRRAVIDRGLERALKGSMQRPQTVDKAMRYGLFSGGKRLRPALLLATGELFGAPRKSLLPFACAMEMIHIYSLIHDDLPALDDDDFRRGQPATHKVFGEGIALLAGDGLLTEAFRVMSEAGAARALEPRRALGLIHEIAQAAGAAGMVGGQVMDLEADDRGADVTTVESLHARKTGALIVASVRVGALLGRAGPKELLRVSRYAELLGLAFQIADDIVDVADSSERNGKDVKRATYPAIVGIAAAKKRVRELLERCLKEIEPFGKKADPLRAIARYIVEPAVQENRSVPVERAPAKSPELKSQG